MPNQQPWQEKTTELVKPTLSPGSYTLSAIKIGDSPLTKDTDYTVSGNTYTIKKATLAKLSTGAATITFEMSGGTNPTATVTVSDTTPHVHGSWSYQASGATITATCGADGCTDPKYSENLTISAPTSLTYDGNAKAATLSSVSGLESNLKNTVASSIRYEGVSPTVYESPTIAPTNAGTYKASITVGTDKTASVEYTIAKATLVVDGTLAASANYGTAVKDITAFSGATVKLGSTSGTTVAGSWSFGSSETAVPDAGSTTAYTATFTPGGEAGNYNALTVDVTPTISQIAYTGAKTGTTSALRTSAGEKTYTMPSEISALAGVGYAVKTKTTANIVDTAAPTFTGNVLSYTSKVCEGTDAKSDTITITVSSTNYSDFDFVLTVNALSKTDLSSSFVTSGITGLDKTYNGTAAAYTGSATVTGHADLNSSLVYEYQGTGTTSYNKSATAPANAGTYKLIISIPDSNNDYVGSAEVPFTIGKKAATVKPKSFTVTVNAATPTLVLEWTGLVGTETLSVDPAPTFAVTKSDTTEIPIADAVKTAGTYTITWNSTGYPSVTDGTGKAGNYSVNINDRGTLTVSNPPSSGDSYTPSLVTEIKQGGSTTADNLSRLVSGKKDLTVTGTNGAKLVFDTTSLKGINAKTTGSVSVKIEDVSKAHQDMEGKNVFSLTVESGGKTVTDFGGSVTVTLPYTLKDGEKAEDVSVWYLASDGTMTELPCTYDAKTGLATFTVTHFSEYVVGVSEWANPFKDVKESDWCYSAVEYANKNGLFAGTSETTFSPSAPMTRQMLWTVLGRLDGQTLTGSGVFDAAKTWATGKGITDGSNPTGQITREQLITILWRYAKSEGMDVSVGEDTNILSYTDAFSISEYAIPAMQWACGAGLVQGNNGALMPQGAATRAQVAAIMMRYAQSAAK